MNLDARTQICALIGNPVEHSFSPLIHNAGFQKTGINFAYVAFRVEKEYLADAIQGIRSLNIRGASITIPHKVHAVRSMDQLDPAARHIGSINTIVNDRGVLTGYNSDGLGALKALQAQQVDLNGKSVLVLGSGGAARAIAVTLAMNTAMKELVIAGIVTDEVAALVADLREISKTIVRGAELSSRFFEEQPPACDVLINCTPVGMYPDVDSSPVPSPFFRKGQAVFDVVYNPPRTALLKQAAEAGCQTISGLEMFINQAVVQFELWTGHKAPEDVMRQVVLDHIGQ